MPSDDIMRPMLTLSFVESSAAQHLPEHEEFLRAARDEFFAAMNTVLDDDVSIPQREEHRVPSDVENWLFSGTLDHPERWAGYERMITALRAGISDGTVVFDELDDVNAFGNLFFQQLHRAPQAVEYYAATGELFDAIKLADRPVALARGFSDSALLKRALGSVCILLYRLYRYDVTSVNRILRSGEDPRDFMSLPLDVRAQLAGLDEDLQDEEQQRHMEHCYELDHAEHIPEHLIFSH